MTALSGPDKLDELVAREEIRDLLYRYSHAMDRRDWALLDTIFASTFDLGGAKLVYGDKDNQGMDEVFLSVIQEDGSFKAVSDLKHVGG